MNQDRVIKLPYGKRTLTARIPEANLQGIYTPQPVEACCDPLGDIARALAEPLDTPPLIGAI